MEYKENSSSHCYDDGYGTLTYNQNTEQQLMDDYSDFPDVTKEQESLPESSEGDFDGPLPPSEYQYSADLEHENFATSPSSSSTANYEVPTAYSRWYTCLECGVILDYNESAEPRYCDNCASSIVIIEQGQSLQSNSNGSLPFSECQHSADLEHEESIVISSFISNTANYEVPTAYSPRPNTWCTCLKCGSILVSNESAEPGYCNNCASSIAVSEQGQSLQSNSNGPLPPSVSGSKRKSNLDLEEQNSPNKKRANNDKTYTASMGDNIINLGRQAGLDIPEGFEFSREQYN